MAPGAASALFLGGLLLLLAAPAAAETVFQELSGRLTLEGRAFPQSSLQSGQREHSVSVVAEPEAYFENAAGNGLVLKPFFRFDSADTRRTHWDMREAYGLFFGEFEDSEWEFRLGLDKVFWGTVESRHLVGHAANPAPYLRRLFGAYLDPVALKDPSLVLGEEADALVAVKPAEGTDGVLLGHVCVGQSITPEHSLRGQLDVEVRAGLRLDLVPRGSEARQGAVQIEKHRGNHGRFMIASQR